MASSISGSSATSRSAPVLPSTTTVSTARRSASGARASDAASSARYAPNTPCFGADRGVSASRVSGARSEAACRAAGVPIYIKSESELSFEAPRLPFIPCHDRWLERADAIARSGASGAWCFPAFKPMYGSSVGEVAKYAGWEPMQTNEEILQQLSARIAGRSAGGKLRKAWKHVSEAIPFSPELPSYYTVNINGGKSFRIRKKYFLNINLSVNNLLNNKNIITGGFESLRWDYGNVDKFDNKYYYMSGATYLAILNINF